MLEALREGDSSPERIVARLYDSLPDALAKFATESILAHLMKLQDDGRVGCRQDAWHIMEP